MRRVYCPVELLLGFQIWLSFIGWSFIFSNDCFLTVTWILIFAYLSRGIYKFESAVISVSQMNLCFTDLCSQVSFLFYSTTISMEGQVLTLRIVRVVMYKRGKGRIEIWWTDHQNRVRNTHLPFKLHPFSQTMFVCSFWWVGGGGGVEGALASAAIHGWTEIKLNLVGFEVLPAVDMKSTIFMDITPCSPLSVNRRFGGTSRIILLATCLHAGFLLNLFFRPWRWRRYVPPKPPLTLNGLLCVISQKMVLFKLNLILLIAVQTEKRQLMFVRTVKQWMVSVKIGWNSVASFKTNLGKKWANHNEKRLHRLLGPKVKVDGWIYVRYTAAGHNSLFMKLRSSFTKFLRNPSSYDTFLSNIRCWFQ
jgi:hypothetical protein